MEFQFSRQISFLTFSRPLQNPDSLPVEGIPVGDFPSDLFFLHASPVDFFAMEFLSLSLEFLSAEVA